MSRLRFYSYHHQVKALTLVRGSTFIETSGSIWLLLCGSQVSSSLPSRQAPLLHLFYLRILPTRLKSKGSISLILRPQPSGLVPRRLATVGSVSVDISKLVARYGLRVFPFLLTFLILTRFRTRGVQSINTSLNHTMRPQLQGLALTPTCSHVTSTSPSAQLSWHEFRCWDASQWSSLQACEDAASRIPSCDLFEQSQNRPLLVWYRADQDRPKRRSV